VKEDKHYESTIIIQYTARADEMRAFSLVFVKELESKKRYKKCVVF